MLQRSSSLQTQGLLLAFHGDRDLCRDLFVTGNLHKIYVKDLFLEGVPLDLLYHYEVALLFLPVNHLQVDQDVRSGLGMEGLGQIFLSNLKTVRLDAQSVQDRGSLALRPQSSHGSLTRLFPCFRL